MVFVTNGSMTTNSRFGDNTHIAETGGCITIKDSGWEFSFAIYDREYFPDQGDKDVLWSDGLFGERNGDYIKKPMTECTGEEILIEFLYHLNMLDMKNNLPKINPLKLLKIRKELLERINRIPPYYQMYPGRDRSVPEKKSVLSPRYPKEY